MSISLLERYQSHIVTNPDTGCDEWQGHCFPNGYGQTTIKGKTKYLHRIIYERVYGEIPEGAMVCHTCDTRNCVNPEHLFLGSHTDNMRDKAAKDRSWSRNGYNT